jgi:hypothetical protein
MTTDAELTRALGEACGAVSPRGGGFEERMAAGAWGRLQRRRRRRAVATGVGAVAVVALMAVGGAVAGGAGAAVEPGGARLQERSEPGPGEPAEDVAQAPAIVDPEVNEGVRPAGGGDVDVIVIDDGDVDVDGDGDGDVAVIVKVTSPARNVRNFGLDKSIPPSRCEASRSSMCTGAPWTSSPWPSRSFAMSRAATGRSWTSCNVPRRRFR